MAVSADSIRVVHPLFQEEGDGSRPISALQLHIGKMESEQAMHFNRDWHSRVPELANWHHCFAFAATYRNRFYGVALWSHPVARMLNGKGMLELRRMALSPEAPKNLASRMLRIMAMLIHCEFPEIRTLISYQDTGVHKGTIYKASGWQATVSSEGGEWSRPSRFRASVQAATPKVRWEKVIK
jgi:hypothetical protein